MQLPIALLFLLNRLKTYSILFLVLVLSGCSLFKKKATTDADVIARVGSDYLYASDLENITRGLHGKDSVTALKNYAENWARKKMLLQKAAEYISEDDAGITKKMADYREALLLYEYEREYIEQKLDTAVKPQELTDWYEKMKDEFILDNDVHRVNFVRLKPDAPDLKDFKKWLTQPQTQEDTLKLNGYCRELSTSYDIEEGMWFEEEKLTQLFPLSKFEIQQLATGKKYLEFKRTDAILYMRITETLRKGQPSPLDFISDRLVKTIIEKRKLQLVDKVYDKIYREGLESKEVEVLVK